MEEPFALNWLDLAIVLTIAGSAGISLLRGFGREILSLINFFTAFVIARLFAPQFAGLLIDTIEQPVIRDIAAYSILFALSLIVGGLVMRAVSMLIKFGGLELFDRLLGTVFGFLRGLIIVVFAVGVINWSGMMAQSRVWNESNLVPLVLPFEQWSRQLVRLWLFNQDMDGLADSLMWQLDALQNNRNLQDGLDNSDRIMRMMQRH